MDLTTPEGRRQQGQRIQRAIIESGHDSLTAFAEKLGCSRALIYQYVNGAVLAQPGRVQAIARLTDKPLEWFYAEDPESLTEQTAALEETVEELRQQVTTLQAELSELRERGATDAGRHQAEVLDLVGELARSHRQGRDARAMLETAQRWREAARAAGESSQESAAWAQIGHAWREMGEMTQARDALQEAVAAAELVADAQAVLGARQELVGALQALGETGEARQHAEHVAEQDSWWARWAGRVALAAIDEQTGDYEGAEERLDQADAILAEQDPGDAYARSARAYAAGNRINVLMGRGRYGAALELSDEMRAAAERSQLRDQMVESWLNVGLCCLHLGRMRRAHEVLVRTSEWAEATEDRTRRVLSLAFLADWHGLAGDAQRAKQLARDALTEAEEGRLRFAQVHALLAVGTAHLREDEPSDAAYYLERAQQAAEEVQARKLGALAQARLAAALAEGDPGRAVDLAQATQRDAAQIGAVDLAAEAGIALADAHLASGAAESALAEAESARAQSEEAGLIHLQWAALVRSARAHVRSGAGEEAARAAEAATHLVGLLRDEGEPRRVQLTWEEARAYADWASALERLGRTTEAEQAWQQIENASLRRRLQQAREESDTA